MGNNSFENFGKVLELKLNYDAYNSRAWACHEKGEDAKGLTGFEKNVALAPTSAYSIETRAEIYEKLGHRDKAIAGYRAELKLDPR
jgi:tetratricopeptide (TPR) repeat protein